VVIFVLIITNIASQQTYFWVKDPIKIANLGVLTPKMIPILLQHVSFNQCKVI